MRRFDPREVFDESKLSEVFSASLNEITNKCHGFTAQKFSKAIHRTPSEITRMKLLSLEPQGKYASLVCLRELRNVLILLLEFFPDLNVYERNDGSIRAVFPIEKLPNLQSYSWLIEHNLLIPSSLGRPQKSGTYAKDHLPIKKRKARKTKQQNKKDNLQEGKFTQMKD